MLTELAYCRKSSINISSDNRYYNRFIHLGRPIFPVNHNGASVFTIPTTFGIAHAHATLARHRSPNLRPECWIIATPQLDALTVPSTHYISDNCTYFQLHLLAGTNSFAIDLMTMKDFFSASATSNAPFLLVGCCDRRWFAVTLAVHVLQKYVS